MNGFGSIQGLSVGWMSAGAVAAMLTVAIHLWNKRSKRVYFPPAILFAGHKAALHRGRRLEDVLMLLLRLLTVATLALAFDQPTLHMGGPESGGPVGHNVVLLLDRSASMQRIEGGRSLFERARQEAAALIRSYGAKPGRIGVVVVDAHPRPLLPELTRNLPALIAQVQNLTPTDDRGDAAAALAAAEALLSSDDHSSSDKIIAFTDLQKSQWADAMDAELAASIEFRDMTRSDPDANNAILSLSTEPSTLRAGESARLNVRIARFADTASSVEIKVETPMRLMVQHVQAPHDGEVVAQFTIEPTTPGELVVRATLIADALESDNAKEAMFPVLNPLRVALVTRSAIDPAGSAIYLAAAVEAVLGHKPAVLAAEELAPTSLVSFDVIIIASARTLGSDTLAALRSNVERGAGLIWIIDSDDALESLKRAEDWAPSIPTSDRMVGRTHLTLDRSSVNRLLNSAREASNEDVLDLIETTSFSTVNEVELQRHAEALISFSDGSPFVAAKIVGAGNVLTVHAKISPAHTDFATSAIFPVFVSTLLQHASPTAAVATTQRDPAESDLNKMTPKLTDAHAGQSFRATGRSDDHPMYELWPVFAAAALFLVMCDMLMGLFAPPGGRLEEATP